MRVVLACMVFALTVQSQIPAPLERISSAPKLGDSKVNPEDGLRYLWIPPGNLTTGCSPGDNECFEDEYPPRKTTLTKGFWLSQTEVTQAAFEKIMGYNPSIFVGDDHPVEMISWNEADKY